MSNWKKLSLEDASQHAAYGLNGSLRTFQALIVIIPALGLLESIGGLTSLISERNGNLSSTDWITIIPYAIYFLWSGYNASLLEKRNSIFLISFLLYLAISPILSIVFTFIWTASQSKTIDSQNTLAAIISIVLVWGVWAAIWIPYMFISDKFNVTILNRVKSE